MCVHAQPPSCTKRCGQMCMWPILPRNVSCHVFLVCINKEHNEINYYSIGYTGYTCTQGAQSWLAHTVGDTGPIQVCPDQFSLPCMKEARVAPDDKGGCGRISCMT